MSKMWSLKLTLTVATTLTISAIRANTDNFSISFNSPEVSPHAAERIKSQIKVVVSKLPPKMMGRIGGNISIQFKKMDEKNQLDVYNICEAGPHILAYTRPLSSHPTIVINDAFLALFNGFDTVSPIPCSHKDLYQKFQSLIIHELSHIYEARAPLTESEKSELQNCQIFRQESTMPDPRCEYLQSLNRFVSSRISFQKLSRARKNALSTRSPDPYELRSPEENFAVNMEYFILDPEFRCRRPAYYKF
ncbi:MAG: hypothetical protein RMK80_02535 [Pseudobdellovibrionaceae bacterium]|nr:hypothetical protein [Pseudobdellovibrionaceae bacterium]